MLTRSAGPVPQAAMIRPATPGPMSRPPLNDALLRATAFGSLVHRHHLGDERLASRVVDSGDHPHGEREGVHVPELRGAGDDEHTEDEAVEGEQALGDEEDPALRVAVGDGTGERREEEEGEELQAGDVAEVARGVVGEDGEDEPVLGYPSHPGPDVGEERAAGVDAVVADLEGAEGGAHSAATRARMAVASRRTSSSASSRPDSRTAIHWSRRRRMLPDGPSTGGREREHDLAPVVGVVGAGDEATFDERGHAPRHARRADALPGGELAEGARLRLEPDEDAEQVGGDVVAALQPDPATDAHARQPEVGGDGAEGHSAGGGCRHRTPS